MIEVGDILTQDLAQVSFIEDKHVIQTLGSHRSHPSLGDRVGLRRSERSTDLRDAEPKDPEIKHRPVTPVAVMDEIARR